MVKKCHSSLVNTEVFFRNVLKFIAEAKPLYRIKNDLKETKISTVYLKLVGYTTRTIKIIGVVGVGQLFK